MEFTADEFTSTATVTRRIGGALTSVSANTGKLSVTRPYSHYPAMIISAPDERSARQKNLPYSTSDAANLQ